MILKDSDKFHVIFELVFFSTVKLFSNCKMAMKESLNNGVKLLACTLLWIIISLKM